MTGMKEVDKFPFLDAPVSSGSLFGPAVEGFAERFMKVSEVISSDATLPPETHQLFCCFQSPQACTDSADS